MEPQATPCLCWAAVGATLLRFYHPDQAMDQRSLARRILGTSETPPYCPVATLDALGLLRAVIEGPLPLEELRAELAAGRVVAAQVNWAFGPRHLVTLSGIDPEDRLWIDDPRAGGGWLPYEELVASPDGWSSWARSLLTGPRRPSLARVGDPQETSEPVAASRPTVFFTGNGNVEGEGSKASVLSSLPQGR